MAEMADSERVMWEQAQRIQQQANEIKGLKRACRTLGGSLVAEIITMQAASIDERLRPGSGMAWIEDTLIEGGSWPGLDRFVPDCAWDGVQSGADWLHARMDEERAHRAAIEAEEGGQ